MCIDVYSVCFDVYLVGEQRSFLHGGSKIKKLLYRKIFFSPTDVQNILSPTQTSKIYLFDSCQSPQKKTFKAKSAASLFILPVRERRRSM